jgi:hypothetical protein
MFNDQSDWLISALLLAFTFRNWIARGVRWALIRFWDLPRWLRYRRWQGCYFEFDAQQVRMCIRGGVVWIAEDDVAALLRPPPTRLELRAIDLDRGPIPGHPKVNGITESGLLRLLALRTGHRRAEHEMIRLQRWFTTEAIPNLRRLPEASM